MICATINEQHWALQIYAKPEKTDLSPRELIDAVRSVATDNGEGR